MCRLASRSVLFILNVLLQVLISVHNVTPFFLCGYHGATQQPGLDADDVIVRVSVDGSPSFYTPGQQYNGEYIRFCIVIYKSLALT